MQLKCGTQGKGKRGAFGNNELTTNAAGSNLIIHSVIYNDYCIEYKPFCGIDQDYRDLGRIDATVGRVCAQKFGELLLDPS